MELAVNILRIGTITLLFVLLVLLLRSKSSRPRAVAAALFCLSVASYLIVDYDPFEGKPLFFVFLIPTFSLPFVFWMFSKALFDDAFSYRNWMLPSWLVIVLVYLAVFLQNNHWQFNLPPGMAVTFGLMPFFISLLLIGLAIIEAVRNMDDDLVLSRLRFRYWFIFLSSLLIIFTILVEIAFIQSQAPIQLELLQRIFIFSLALFFTFERLQFKPGFFKDDAQPDVHETPPLPQIDASLLEGLKALIEDEKFYKTEGLTIRSLAEKLGVKEYKLRQAINQKLGYRNFNDFLNHYRIKDACGQLSDPSQKEMTVLEIAYALGYNSLAPFNKAFKKITGMTPTEWRRSR